MSHLFLQYVHACFNFIYVKQNKHLKLINKLSNIGKNLELALL